MRSETQNLSMCTTHACMCMHATHKNLRHETTFLCRTDPQLCAAHCCKSIVHMGGCTVHVHMCGCFLFMHGVCMHTCVQSVDMCCMLLVWDCVCMSVDLTWCSSCSDNAASGLMHNHPKIMPYAVLEDCVLMLCCNEIMRSCYAMVQQLAKPGKILGRLCSHVMLQWI